MSEDTGDTGQGTTVLTGGDTNPTDSGTTTEQVNAAEAAATDQSVNPEAGGDPGESGNTDSAGDEGDGATDSYADFNLPEGIQPDTAMLEKAIPVFKDLGLTQEQAQKLVDLRAEQVQAETEQAVTSHNELIEQWLSDAKNDKQIGGDNWDQSLKLSQNAVNKFGTPEFKTLLNDYGIGNHPEMIRVMANIGKLLDEDSPGSDNAPANPKMDRVSILYPKETANQ